MPRMKSKAKHPKYEAIANNSPTYMSPEGWRGCKRCGGREFYVTNSACVACARQRPEAKSNYRPSGIAGMPASERAENIAAKKQAIAVGSPVYQRTRECPTCFALGIVTFLRYTRNGGCVECQKQRSRRQYADRTNGPVDSPAPLIASPSNCHHGEMLRTLIPELNGQTLRLVRHWWGKDLLGEPAHYGKCALCHPSRTIQLYNKMRTDGGMPADLHHIGSWLSRMMMVTPVWPRGLLSQCLSEKGRQSQAEKVDGVPLAPVPILKKYSPTPPDEILRLQRAHDEAAKATAAAIAAIRLPGGEA